MTDWKRLAEPFPPTDIEWRVGQAGKNAKGVWCKVLAYCTNRAIMARLDEVCGPQNWKNEFRYEPNGAVLCGLSIYNGERGEWVTKWDGAENTDIEAVKGGLSNAMKRAAVQWGIGRYLYDLEEGWGIVSEAGEHYVGKNDKKDMPAFRWSPPKLPAWALPDVARGEVGGVPASDLGKTGQRVGTQPLQESRTPQSSSAPAPSGPKLVTGGMSDKPVSMKQKHVDVLLKAGHGMVQEVAQIVERIMHCSGVTDKAATWPMMNGEQYHAIVHAIEGIDVPDAILVDELADQVRERLKDQRLPAKLKVNVLAELERGERDENLTIPQVRGMLADLIVKPELE